MPVLGHRSCRPHAASGIVAATLRPRLAGRIDSEPPSAATRSRMPVRPKPADCSTWPHRRRHRPRRGSAAHSSVSRRRSTEARSRAPHRGAANWSGIPARRDRRSWRRAADVGEVALQVELDRRLRRALRAPAVDEVDEAGFQPELLGQADCAAASAHRAAKPSDGCVACEIIRASCATSPCPCSRPAPARRSPRSVLAKARMAERFCPNSSCSSRASARRSSSRISIRRRVSAARCSVPASRRPPSADGAADHGKLHRAEARQRRAILAARHALQGGRRWCAPAPAYARSQARQAGRSPAAISSATSIIVQDVLPGERDRGVRIGVATGRCRRWRLRGLTGRRPLGVAAEQGRHGRGEPAWRRPADPLALAAERLFECAAGWNSTQTPGRDQLHRLERAPIRNRQEMLARSVAAQQELVPVQRLKRLRDPLARRPRLPGRRCDRRRTWPRRSRRPGTARR